MRLCPDLPIMIICFYRPAGHSHREKLCEILHSHKAQYAIITLVVLDMIIVIAELLLDLRAIKGKYWQIIAAIDAMHFTVG